MSTSSVASPSGKTEIATFCSGCFWGPEYMFRKHYGQKGLLDATVGYVGGQTKSPTYREVCSGSTGHAEACQLTFDPQQVSYGELVEFFYRTHDPTQVNRQGPDIGTQYRSMIVTHSAEQDQVARQVTEQVQKEHFDPKGTRIATEIVSINDTQYWPGEEYHQRYLEHNRALPWSSPVASLIPDSQPRGTIVLLTVCTGDDNAHPS